MVSWIINIKLKHTLSPTVRDIIELSKEKGFSNVEGIEHIKTKGEYTYYKLNVNNRSYNHKSDMVLV